MVGQVGVSLNPQTALDEARINDDTARPEVVHYDLSANLTVVLENWKNYHQVPINNCSKAIWYNPVVELSERGIAEPRGAVIVHTDLDFSYPLSIFACNCSQLSAIRYTYIRTCTSFFGLVIVDGRRFTGRRRYGCRHAFFTHS